MPKSDIMEELTRKQKKDFAKMVYLSEKGITQKEVAARVGTTEGTVSKWATEGKWAVLRTSLLGTKEATLAWLYNQLIERRAKVEERKEEEGGPVASKGDLAAIKDLTASIRALETETNISQKVEVGKQFLVFLRQFDAQKALEYLPLYDAFIKEAMQ